VSRPLKAVDGWAGHAYKSGVKWVWKILKSVPGLVVAVVVLALAYFHVVGFPGFVREFVQREISRRGVAVRFTNIRLDLLHGIVATGVVLADAKSPEQTLAAIDQVQLLWNWRRMLRRDNAVDAIRIVNAEVSIPTPADEFGPEVFTARGASAVVYFEDDGSLRLDYLTGTYAGIQVVLTGRLKPSGTAGVSAPPPPGAAAKPMTLVTKVVRELGRIQGIERVELDVTFDVDLARPWDGQATVTLQGDGLKYRNLQVDKARVRVNLNRGALQIEPLLVELYGGAIVVRGRYDFGQSLFDLTVDSTTDLSRLRVLLPEKAARELATLEFTDRPHLAARYVLSPETGALPQLTATVDIGRAALRGVRIRALRGTIAGQGPVWTVRDAVLITPEGRAAGRGQIHAESTDFEYEFDSTVDPVKLLPLLPPSMARFVEPASFGPPPHIKAKVRGDFVDPEAFAYDAEVSAGACSYRGVPLTGASARLRLRTSRLDVQDLTLQRPEGELRGTVLANFDTHRVRFDVRTSANPTALAPLLGPKAGQIMQSYRFGSNIVASAQGLVDFDRPEQTAWTAQAACDGFSYWKFTAAHAKAGLLYTNNTLALRDLDADFYDGVLSGWANFDFRRPDVQYELQLTPTRADVNQILHAVGARSKVTGYLTGDLRLQGRGSDLATLHGDGWLEVTDGILWEGPLFGIFSKILGNTKATSAKATFVVEEQAVKTDDLAIAAGLFSAKSRGKVGFDGKLDFRVEARFLNAIPGWNILSTILGKVLEYQVGGTLGNPSYRASNFPKGLLPHED